MTLLETLARIAVGWLVLSVIVCGAYAVVMARHNRRRPDVVRRPSYPPPVPAPVTQTDEAWLSVWPTDVQRADIDQLEQRVYDRLFDDILAIEGLS